jgi:hypothetical protein
MIPLVRFIGGVAAVVGLYGIIAPVRFLALAGFWGVRGRVYLGAAIRLAMGTLFVLAAPNARVPRALAAIGWITVGAAIGTAILPQPVVARLTAWMAGLRPTQVRLLGVLALAYGLAVAFVA